MYQDVKDRIALRKHALRARRCMLLAACLLTVALVAVPHGWGMPTRIYGGHASVVSVDALLGAERDPARIPEIAARDDIVNIDPDTGWVGLALAPEYQVAMQVACVNKNVPYALALAVCQQASGFDPDAGGDGHVGLMQIAECNREALARKGYDIGDPVGNIAAGVDMLSGYLQGGADPALALMRYSMGPGKADDLWGRGIHSTDYSVAVVEKAAAWDALLSQSDI